MDMALNDQQRLICNKPKRLNKRTKKQTHSSGVRLLVKFPFIDQINLFKNYSHSIGSCPKTSKTNKINNSH